MQDFGQGALVVAAPSALAPIYGLSPRRSLGSYEFRGGPRAEGVDSWAFASAALKIAMSSSRHRFRIIPN